MSVRKWLTAKVQPDKPVATGRISLILTENLSSEVFWEISLKCYSVPECWLYGVHKHCTGRFVIATRDKEVALLP